MKRHRLLSVIASLTALSACGGGGGSPGTSGTPPVQNSTLSTITSAAAPRAASNAYAATMSVSMSSSSLTDILTGVSVNAGPTLSTVSPVLTLVRRARSTPQLLAGVTTSENCSGGGSVTVDATLRSQQTISNGDTITLTAKNCVEDGETLDGTMAITFSNMSGDIVNTWVYGATMDTRFTSFNISDASIKVGINGDMKIVINQTSATSNTVTISGQSLQTTAQQGSAAAIGRTLTGYAMTGSTQGTTTTGAADFTLSGSSGALGQFSYTVKNLQPFVTTGSAMPGSGALIVNGAASSVTATVVANGVRLDFSAAGNGTITQTNTLSWTDFLASF